MTTLWLPLDHPMALCSPHPPLFPQRSAPPRLPAPQHPVAFCVGETLKTPSLLGAGCLLCKLSKQRRLADFPGERLVAPRAAGARRRPPAVNKRTPPPPYRHGPQVHTNNELNKSKTLNKTNKKQKYTGEKTERKTNPKRNKS